jgi:succinate dehydrogenase / fumarate reductase iron-sulfur subunit
VIGIGIEYLSQEAAQVKLPRSSPPAGKTRRVLNMVKQMDKEGFGNCTVTGSCEAVCPKEISLSFIAKMNRDYGVAILKGR